MCKMKYSDFSSYNNLGNEDTTEIEIIMTSPDESTIPDTAHRPLQARRHQEPDPTIGTTGGASRLGMTHFDTFNAIRRGISLKYQLQECIFFYQFSILIIFIEVTS